MTATDNVGGSGVSVTRYTTDGTNPTKSGAGGNTYTGAFRVAATTTIKFASWDVANNAETVKTQVVTVTPAPPVDITAPVTTITCNGGTCTGSLTGPVSVALAATDNAGGSGVSVTRYTTDGTNPTKTGTGGTTYTAPFSVTATTTIKFASWDVANNAETVKTQVVTVATVGTPVVIQNPSFETPTGATAVPTCWQQGSAGTNTATWSHTSDAHTGSFAEKVTITQLHERRPQDRADPRLRNLRAEDHGGQDLQARRVVQGHRARSRSPCSPATPPAPGSSASRRSNVAASANWAQATVNWTQPVTSSNGCGSSTGYVPTDISFGLALSSVGNLTVDDATIQQVN